MAPVNRMRAGKTAKRKLAGKTSTANSPSGSNSGPKPGPKSGPKPGPKSGPKPCPKSPRPEEAIAGFMRVLERFDAAPAPNQNKFKQNKAMLRAPEGK